MINVTTLLRIGWKSARFQQVRGGPSGSVPLPLLELHCRGLRLKWLATPPTPSLSLSLLLSLFLLLFPCQIDSAPAAVRVTITLVCVCLLNCITEVRLRLCSCLLILLTGPQMFFLPDVLILQPDCWSRCTAGYVAEGEME